MFGPHVALVIADCIEVEDLWEIALDVGERLS